jgi:hypothetical protein
VRRAVQKTAPAESGRHKNRGTLDKCAQSKESGRSGTNRRIPIPIEEK